MKIRCLFSVLAVLFGITPLSAEVPGSLLSKAPLVFEPNYGQAPEDIQFLSRGNGYGLFLTPTEAVLSLVRPEPATVRMSLVGQNPDPAIAGVERQNSVSNYLLGNPEDWRSEIPHFSKVRYSGVYPGIDVVYYGNQRQLEYDFLLAPGADSHMIRMEFGGIRHLAIAPNGDLILKTPTGEIRHQRPIAYQEIEGERRPVEVSFVLRGARRAGFEVAAYDPELPLVIDPKLEWSAYLGGAETDSAVDVAVDDFGNAYVTGYTQSPDFWRVNALDDTKDGTIDAFVMKIGSASSILWSTYIGGSGDDEGHGIAVDAAGNPHVTGFTTSTDWPVVNAFAPTHGGGLDGYVLKLSSDGTSILYSTYLGGSQLDRGYGIVMDAAGNALIAGTTQSRNFPIQNALNPSFAGGLADAFLTKLSPAGDLLYSTYLGGLGNDNAYDLALDSDGNTILTGFTSSPNFPTVNALGPNFRGGADDAFVTKFNAAGNGLIFSTYFGGSDSDNAVGVAVDSNNNIIVTGYTASLDFPLKRPAQLFNNGLYDAFLVKFHPDGLDAEFSTYIGGEDSDSGVAVDIGPNDSIYLVGFTSSFNFYAINAVGGFLRGGRDAFVMKIANDASVVVFSSFLGGFSFESATGLSVDAAGNAYVVGFTTSVDFPVVTGTFQDATGGGQDGFIVRIDPSDIVTSSPFSLSPAASTSIATAGQTANPIFGYARTDMTSGSHPSGLEIVDLRSVGTLVNEVSMPATQPIWVGRLLARTFLSDNTALSMVNPSDADIHVDYYFTGEDGDTSHFGFFVLPAKRHVSAFLRDEPFNVPLDRSGTLTFTASDYLFVTALRVDETGPNPVNSWIPIVDPYTANDRPVTIPVVADGLGWNSQIFLVNTTEFQMDGEVRLFRDGNEIEVATELGVNSVFEYSIPPRSVRIINTRGESSELISAFVDVVPFAGSSTPASFAQLTYTDVGGYMRTTVEAVEPGQRFSSYAEVAGTFFEPLASRPSIAIANRLNTPATVQITLTDLNGAPTGLSATVSIPGRSHLSRFLYEIPEFANLPNPFQGVLTVTTTDPGVTAVGFRARYNERNLFLTVATGPLRDLGGHPAVFPHLVDGGGYATQFILVNGASSVSGSLQYVDQSGNPLNVAIAP